ncbi:hypothetical protein ABID23_000779 [Bartonella silvatica]|uniref:Uncharacterized protein n=1 Tax=Bartonella silvatica TaxID=357760 RepID=A0ABV2HGL9_9HYPH
MGKTFQKIYQSINRQYHHPQSIILYIGFLKESKIIGAMSLAIDKVQLDKCSNNRFKMAKKHMSALSLSFLISERA